MPWTPEYSTRHNHALHSTRQRQMWAEIANEALAKTGDEGRAVHTANSRMKPRHESMENHEG